MGEESTIEALVKVFTIVGHGNQCKLNTMRVDRRAYTLVITYQLTLERWVLYRDVVKHRSVKS
jgi:hypothetical protein